MSIYIRDGGSWRDSTVYVKNSGTWRQTSNNTSAYYSGSWRNLVVAQIRILAWGAAGGGTSAQCFSPVFNAEGGAGGFVDAEGNLSGSTLTIYVGQGGIANGGGRTYGGGGASPYHASGGGATTIYIGGTLIMAVGAGAGAGRSGAYAGGSNVGDGHGGSGGNGGNINVGGGDGAGPGFGSGPGSPGGYLNGGDGSPGRGAGGGSGYYGGGGGQGDNGACDGLSGNAGCSYINGSYFTIINSNSKSANSGTPPGTGSGYWGNNAGFSPTGRNNGNHGRVVVLNGNTVLGTFGYTGGAQTLTI